MKTFDDLTSEQKDAFWADAAMVGLSEHEVLEVLDVTDFGEFACTSADPDLSHVATKRLVVEDLDHMKKLAGIADEHYENGRIGDRHIEYPAPLDDLRIRELGGLENQCMVVDRLSASEAAQVLQAYRAYVLGYSKKVDPRMKALAQTVHFPSTCTVAAAKSLIVKDGTFKLFSGPKKVCAVYGTVSVAPSAALVFGVGTHIKSQVSEMQAI